ncbi:MAG: hypothetical protein WBP29_07405 [Candidatus Zixiibacteriota bacterium]
MLQHRILCTVVLLLCSITSSYIAAAPMVINYQGRLTTASGTPMADGPQTIVVKLWNSPTETAPQFLLWDSGPIGVAVHDGVFSTLLEFSAIALVNIPEVYFAIQIPPDSEGLPRRRVVSSPYAIDAQHAGFSESTTDFYIDAVVRDCSLILPNDAFNSAETLNEPGIAANQSNLITTLSLEMAGITSVSITIPTDGYINLQGRCGVRLVGGTGYITSVVHFTEDPSASASFPNAVELTSPIGTFTPEYVSSIYFETAGTYTL